MFDSVIPSKRRGGQVSRYSVASALSKAIGAGVAPLGRPSRSADTNGFPAFV
jgi:hypothetical protein